MKKRAHGVAPDTWKYDIDNDNDDDDDDDKRWINELTV